MHTIYSMNYDKIYKQIIEFRKENPLDKDHYGENHHIIPRSLGGSDDNENLVRLSAREHFICHMLLAEMYPKETFEWYKMNHAFLNMRAGTVTGMRYINNRYYELKKKDFGKSMSFSQSGSKNSGYDTAWIHSITEKKSLKIHKSLVSDYLENGYELGRVMNFDKKLNPNNYKNSKNKWVSKKPKIDNNLYYEDLIISLQRQKCILKIFGINLIEYGTDEFKQFLIKLYLYDKRSTLDIARMFNSNNETIRNYLKFFKIERRCISDAVKNSLIKQM